MIRPLTNNHPLGLGLRTINACTMFKYPTTLTTIPLEPTYYYFSPGQMTSTPSSSSTNSSILSQNAPCTATSAFPHSALYAPVGLLLPRVEAQMEPAKLHDGLGAPSRFKIPIYGLQAVVGESWVTRSIFGFDGIPRGDALRQCLIQYCVLMCLVSRRRGRGRSRPRPFRTLLAFHCPCETWRLKRQAP